jgi:hypothetical protein
MSEAWIFTHPDTWTRTEVPAWPEEEGDGVDDWMALLGYKPHSRADNSDLVEFVGSWMLYIALAPDAPYAHALLVDGAVENCVLVWLPTFPDLLAYMAKYGEVGQPAWERIEWEEVADAVKRMFRAWHGHASTTFCRECDPDQYARWQEKQAERRAKKGVL